MISGHVGEGKFKSLRFFQAEQASFLVFGKDFGFLFDRFLGLSLSDHVNVVFFGLGMEIEGLCAGKSFSEIKGKCTGISCIGRYFQVCF